MRRNASAARSLLPYYTARRRADEHGELDEISPDGINADFRNHRTGLKTLGVAKSRSSTAEVRARVASS